MSYRAICRRPSLNGSFGSVSQLTSVRRDLNTGRSLNSLSDVEIARLAESYPSPQEVPAPELRKFRMKLDLLEKLIPNPVIPYRRIWEGSLTQKSEFADDLKHITGDLTHQYWCMRKPILKSYNHIFPYRHLPRWDMKIDDMEYRMIPVSMDLKTKELFRIFVQRELSETLSGGHLAIPSIESAKERFFNSVSYSYSERKKYPLAHFIGKELVLPEVYKFIRCKVPVFPGGGRDAVIADWNTGVLLRWGELAYKQILPFFKESVIGVSPSIMDARMRAFWGIKGKTFFLRDFKKCGLTYSPEILKIVGDEVSELTGCSLFKLHAEGFMSQEIFDPETSEVIVPKRGYGLGMCNHLATLCMILTFRFAWYIMGKQPPRAVFFNDDSCICVETPEYEELMDNYLSIEEDLGNLINREKCAISIAPILLEEYGSGIWTDSKMSLKACELVDIMFIENDDLKAIRLNMALKSLYGSRWEPMIPMLFSYVASSLANKEFMEIPYAAGGANPGTETCLGSLTESIDNTLMRHKLEYYSARREIVNKFLSRTLYSEDDQKYGSHIPRYFQTSLSCSWEQEKIRLCQKKENIYLLAQKINKILKKRRIVGSLESIYRVGAMEGYIYPQSVTRFADQLEVIQVDARCSSGLQDPDPDKEIRICHAFGGKTPWPDVYGNLELSDFDQNPRFPIRVEDRITPYPKYPGNVQYLPGYGIPAIRNFYIQYGVVPCHISCDIKINHFYSPEDFINFYRCDHIEKYNVVIPVVDRPKLLIKEGFIQSDTIPDPTPSDLDSGLDELLEEVKNKLLPSIMMQERGIEIEDLLPVTEEVLTEIEIDDLYEELRVPDPEEVPEAVYASDSYSDGEPLEDTDLYLQEDNQDPSLEIDSLYESFLD